MSNLRERKKIANLRVDTNRKIIVENNKEWATIHFTDKLEKRLPFAININPNLLRNMNLCWRTEVENFIIDNLQGEWYIDSSEWGGSISAHFEKDSDAIMFKLKFG